MPLSNVYGRYSGNMIPHVMRVYTSCSTQLSTNYQLLIKTKIPTNEEVSSQYVNWNKHPVPVPPSSRLIHYELQHSCVTSCQKLWCESCWYSCNCEGPPIEIHFSIDLSNCYSYNHVTMYGCDCQFHLNHANWHLSSFSVQNGSDCEQVAFNKAKCKGGNR